MSGNTTMDAPVAQNESSEQQQLSKNQNLNQSVQEAVANSSDPSTWHRASEDQSVSNVATGGKESLFQDQSLPTGMSTMSTATGDGAQQGDPMHQYMNDLTSVLNSSSTLLGDISNLISNSGANPTGSESQLDNSALNLAQSVMNLDGQLLNQVGQMPQFNNAGSDAGAGGTTVASGGTAAAAAGSDTGAGGTTAPSGGTAVAGSDTGAGGTTAASGGTAGAGSDTGAGGTTAASSGTAGAGSDSGAGGTTAASGGTAGAGSDSGAGGTTAASGGTGAAGSDSGVAAAGTTSGASTDNTAGVTTTTGGTGSDSAAGVTTTTGGAGSDTAAGADTGAGGTTVPATGGFTVENGQIIGPDGQPFVAKGIGVGVSDAINDQAQISQDFPGLNFIRLDTGPNRGDSIASIQQAINTWTSKGVVVEVGDIDSFGGVDNNVVTGQDLTNELQWYSQIASANVNNPNVWFSTANEPSDTADPQAVVNQESSIYSAIRDTGNNNMILMENNPTAMQGDPGAYSGMTNIGIDVHYYGWETNYSTDQNTVDQKLDSDIAQAGSIITDQQGTVPLVIGEYGNATTSSGVDPNGSEVVTAVDSSGLGSVAWNWDLSFLGGAGNIDSLTNGNGGLTDYGQQVASYINND